MSSDAELAGSECLEVIELRVGSEQGKATVTELRMQVGFAKSSDPTREREAVKSAAIADRADSEECPVSFMCRELGVSRSGYYNWRNAEPSQRSKDDATLISIVKKI